MGHLRLGRNSHWLAAVLTYGDAALLSHRAAATLWGLDKSRFETVDVTAPMRRQGPSRRPGLWIHRGRLHIEDRDERAAIPGTSVARTLFDLAEVVDGNSP